jgi:hypothetical protein
MPSQKSAQKSAGKASSNLAGKPGQPKKASAAESNQKRKVGKPITGGTV